MTKTEYQMRLLAGALDAEGKLVHPGLRKPIGITRGSESPWFEQTGWTINHDPMALIAATWAKEWTVGFEAGDGINIFVMDSEGDVVCFSSDATNWDDVPAALTDAVFQATEPLAENWMECINVVQTDDGGNDSWYCTECLCQDGCLLECSCHGTGKVLKEAQDARS